MSETKITVRNFKGYVLLADTDGYGNVKQKVITAQEAIELGKRLQVIGKSILNKKSKK